VHAENTLWNHPGGLCWALFVQKKTSKYYKKKGWFCWLKVEESVSAFLGNFRVVVVGSVVQLKITSKVLLMLLKSHCIGV
jgi:hypothetical protein